MRGKPACLSIRQETRLGRLHDQVGDDSMWTRVGKVDRLGIVGVHPAWRRVDDEIV
jgi:hypothetical protein